MAGGSAQVVENLPSKVGPDLITNTTKKKKKNQNLKAGHGGSQL
jgi:hypothetical protein